MDNLSMYKCTHLTLLLAGLMLACLAHAENPSLQDPTKPSIEVLASMPEMAAVADVHSLALSGLKTNGAQSVAIVNNTFVKVGDSVQGYRFVGVKGQEAIFEDESHQRLLLKPNIVDYRKFAATESVAKKRRKQHTINRQK